VDVEIAVLRRRRPDADRLVGHGDVERVHIGIGIDRDGADAEPARRAHDAARDLTPVGDQELGEHRCWLGAFPRPLWAGGRARGRAPGGANSTGSSRRSGRLLPRSRRARDFLARCRAPTPPPAPRPQGAGEYAESGSTIISLDPVWLALFEEGGDAFAALGA